MAECARLESGYTARYQRFESSRLRSVGNELLGESVCAERASRVRISHPPPRQFFIVQTRVIASKL